MKNVPTRVSKKQIVRSFTIRTPKSYQGFLQSNALDQKWEGEVCMYQEISGLVFCIWLLADGLEPFIFSVSNSLDRIYRFSKTWVNLDLFKLRLMALNI
jgi:hypothetical protein